MIRKLALAIPIVAALVLAIPAAASPPMDVNIEVFSETPPGGVTTGIFRATGPAVNSGLLCASGDILDVNKNVTGFQGGNGVIVHARRLFTCEDGSPSFVLKLNAQIRSNPSEVSGSWNILSGTGSYEKLHGSGELVDSEFDPTTGAGYDLLSGRMHTD